jgi:O-acetylserine/cysteine efflux transporter
VVLGVVKFGLLFLGMHAGMPAGLSSLVLQSQAVFTAAFAALLLGERPGRRRLLGLGIGVAGMVLAALDQGSAGPMGAFVLVLVAAVAWGLSNVLTRRAAPPDVFRWMVWVSVVPPVPLLLLSLVFEGEHADLAALRSIGPTGVGALLYVAWGATLFGFGAWGYLMRHHDASVVAPFSLLVPVFGMSSAWLLLGEPITPLAGCAALLVIAGIGLGSFGGRADRAGRADPAGRGSGVGRVGPVSRAADVGGDGGVDGPAHRPGRWTAAAAAGWPGRSGSPDRSTPPRPAA